MVTVQSLPLGSLDTITFMIVCGVYIIFSCILHYHWRTYSVDAHITKLTLTSYYTLTLLFLAIAGSMVLII